MRRLIELDEAPWGDLKGRPLDDRGLAQRLKHYGIKSKNLKIEGLVVKGYSRSDLHDAWERYLPALPANNATSATAATLSVAATVSVARVAQVANLAGNGGDQVRTCDHCHKGGDLQQVYCGGEEAWLHRDCQKSWLAAQDDLTIPAYLDRRNQIATP